MAYLLFHTSDAARQHIVSHLLFVAALVVSTFVCSQNASAKEFIYKGIVYEVNDNYSDSPNTCSTAYKCCDYMSDLTADGNLVIPEEVYDENGVKYEVTAIGSYSFEGDYKLLSISLPITLSRIYRGAFFGCSSLESLRLPEGVNKIDEKAFMHCTGLVSIDFPQGLIRIEWEAFANCESLQSLYIPDSVEFLGPEAFSGCASLKNVKLPEGDTTIGYGLFAECTSLETVEFAETLKEIQGWFIPDSHMSPAEPVPSPFYKCTSLRYLKFPDSVEEIDALAFEGCTGVETIVLSKNLKKLGTRAFDFKSLKEVIYPVSDPIELPVNYHDYYDEITDEYNRVYFGYGFLDATYDIATLKVGLGVREKALQTVPWKFFKHIEEVDFSGVERIVSEPNECSTDVYRTDGVRVGDSTDGLPSGLYIVRTGGKISKIMVP